MEDRLTQEERTLLLRLARKSLQDAVCGVVPAPLDLAKFPPRLQEPGATFVTLTRLGDLRGCVGTLEPSLPLAEDVCERAASAGLHDYRFPPVRPEELPEISIEISRLTLPMRIQYDCPEDLLRILRPGRDGVLVHDGYRRATFLPQVWEKVPDPNMFLDLLCQKMGASTGLWRSKKLQFSTYEVEEFHE